MWPSGNIRTAFESVVVRPGSTTATSTTAGTFASWFVMRGGALQALKEILGYADLKMTLRYAPEHVRYEIAARWSAVSVERQRT